jgi:ATP adenylyltransferase
MSYIQSHKHDDACAFCQELTQPDGPHNLIVFRGKDAFLILNRYPYTSGHLMVVPFDHEPSLEGLEAAARAEMMEIATRSMQVLEDIYHPQGFNLGINIGAAAGAGITGHVHMHIVPRWGGDTNFMSTVGSTRVLPESLEVTYERVSSRWNQED